MTYLGLLFLLLVGGGFWFDTQRTYLIAKMLCMRVCQELQLQLLDDTVTLIRIRLKRNAKGRLSFQRTYSFEVTEHGGNTRHLGILILRGDTLEIVELPGYLNRTILPV